MEKRPRFSIVVPVCNEAGNITKLDRELKGALKALPGGFEVIYVNDGSTDGSATELAALPLATVVTLQKNYGQSTAFQAGFDIAQGELVISLDGDGQNDPADIPKLLKTLEEQNLDVVAGWRVNRRDRGGVRVLTRIGRVCRRILLDDRVHDSGCTLRIYRAAAVKSLDLTGEMHRYVLGLLRWKGFRIGEVPVNDRPRLHGKSKYGYSKAIRGFIDLLYLWFLFKYSQRPLHLFGYLSFFSFAIAFIAGILTIYERLFLNIHVNDNGWFFLTCFFGLTGFLLFSFGIVIDLLIRIYLTTSPSQRGYYVRRIDVQ